MTEDPKPPSPVSLILSVVVTVFLLWSLFGGGEAKSGTLTALYWVLILLNLAFLGYALFGRRK